MSDGIDPEDELGTCSADGCFERAGVMSTITLRPNVLTGAAEEDDPIVLVIPLCVLKHAHLLRMTPTLVRFDDRLS